MTGKYAVKIVMNHALKWNYDTNRCENLCHKSSPQTPCIKMNGELMKQI
jgi:hypothetical protein